MDRDLGHLALAALNAELVRYGGDAVGIVSDKGQQTTGLLTPLLTKFSRVMRDNKNKGPVCRGQVPRRKQYPVALPLTPPCGLRHECFSRFVTKFGGTSANILEIRSALILLDNVFIPPFDGPKTSTSK
jgi:hypothetical protein